MKLKPWLIALAVAVAAVVVLLVATRGTIRQAAESYVYGYPLVLMDVTQRAFTATRAAPNSLFNVPVFPDPDFREVVRPNVDTLYSIAWLDLADGPQVFEVPATDRYYVMQLLDGWTNVFASIGPRTTGRGAGVFLIAGPGWDGPVPDGATLLRSPTRIAWLLGRIQTNGVADYEFVHGLQAQLRLRSLEDFVAGSDAGSNRVAARRNRAGTAAFPDACHGRRDVFRDPGAFARRQSARGLGRARARKACEPGRAPGPASRGMGLARAQGDLARHEDRGAADAARGRKSEGRPCGMVGPADERRRIRHRVRAAGGRCDGGAGCEPSG